MPDHHHYHHKGSPPPPPLDGFDFQRGIWIIIGIIACIVFPPLIIVALIWWGIAKLGRSSY